MEKAFDFTLMDDQGQQVSLHDFLGQKVVLYFYPKDSTPGCTLQACSYRDHVEEFTKRKIKVFGISKDSLKSHQSFIAKQNLNFQLLSDPQLTTMQAYGVWKEKMLYGKSFMGVARTTFVIDEQGYIIKRFDKVKPLDDVSQVITLIDSL